MNKFHAETIEDVITIMDEIIRNCRVRGSRIGYFTVLYRTVTYMVKKYCDQGGFFSDDERMRRLDTAFANHYFSSLFSELHYETKPPAKSWKASFDAADDSSVILIQHLLVGMNAHISLDLGIATAMIADGNLDEALKHDFFLLNSVLASLIHVIQAELSTVSPLMGLLDQVTLRFENYIVDQGIRLARTRAWYFAEKLTASPREEWTELIAEQDKEVARISQRILSPGWLFRPALWVVRQQEKSLPHEVMSGLAGEAWYEEAHLKVLEVLGTTGDFDADFMKRETQLMRAVSLPSESN
jgi:uncharacterized protein DUF5995